MTEVLTYVELDIDFCENNYGVAPCTASIPTTGSAKCFNSKKTCQDRPNYNSGVVTLRFAKNTAYLPKDIECIPVIKGVSFTPAIISLGEDLGQRATLSIVMEDIPHPDTSDGFDKYRTERDYDPFRQGTLFGKFRARQPFIRGRSLRLIRGAVGQALGDMDVRHYVVDSFDGPTPQGMYTLVAKDVLKLADDDRAKAPRLSQGRLNAGIDASVTSFTLSPVGIGDAEYPAAGKVCLSGTEICTFTRSGNTMTISRGQFNTTAVAHSAGDRAQVCLEYNANEPSGIIYDLLVNFAGVDADYIPLADWLLETSTYLVNLYTTLITEPTGVNSLMSELIQQAALAVWWDDQSQLIRLQVLRAVATNAAQFTPDNTWERSLTAKEQPDKRLSQVWTYYARRDPTRPLDEKSNYRASLLTADVVSESDYGSAVIKLIFSRWIPQGGQTIAERLNNRVLGRYRDPPRRFNFDVTKNQTVTLGGGYRIASHMIQADTGALTDTPIQVTKLNPDEDRFRVEGEEVLFTEYDSADLTNRVVILDANTNDINLRSLHDSIYPALTAADVLAGVNVTFIVQAGVVVNGSSVAGQGIHVGSWVSGADLTLQNLGRITGAGGRGGVSGNPHGENGGTAIYTRTPIKLVDVAGQLWGGGGGGGHGTVPPGFTLSSGGSGAGKPPGVAGPGATPGTETSGGLGGQAKSGSVTAQGGNGGGPGLPGTGGYVLPSTPTTNPGAAGKAIDGISYATTVGLPGDRRGGQVN